MKNINNKNLNKLLSALNSLDKDSYRILLNSKQNRSFINKLKNLNSEWLSVFKYLENIFNNSFSLNVSESIRSLSLTYNLVRFNFVTKSNILFILPEEKKYDLINKKFIKLFKNYKIDFLHNRSFKKVLGFLTNFKRSNQISKNKKPNLIIMFNTDDYYKNGVIKEADLLNIPIISLISPDIIYSKLYTPLLGNNLNISIFDFYYHFFNKLMKDNKNIRNNFYIKKNTYTSNKVPNISLITTTVINGKQYNIGINKYTDYLKFKKKKQIYDSITKQEGSPFHHLKNPLGTWEPHTFATKFNRKFLKKVLTIVKKPKKNKKIKNQIKNTKKEKQNRRKYFSLKSKNLKKKVKKSRFNI